MNPGVRGPERMGGSRLQKKDVLTLSGQLGGCPWGEETRMYIYLETEDVPGRSDRGRVAPVRAVEAVPP